MAFDPKTDKGHRFQAYPGYNAVECRDCQLGLSYVTYSSGSYAVCPVTVFAASTPPSPAPAVPVTPQNAPVGTWLECINPLGSKLLRKGQTYQVWAWSLGLITVQDDTGFYNSYDPICFILAPGRPPLPPPPLVTSPGHTSWISFPEPLQPGPIFIGCVRCGAELSSYLDAYHGRAPDQAAKCAKCRALKGAGPVT